MKQMQIKFSTSVSLYQYVKDIIGFQNVDEYLTTLIENERDSHGKIN